MSLGDGYKMTEIGKIPEEWELLCLRELVVFRNGKAHENEISEDGRFIVINSKFVSTEGCVRKYTNECIAPLFKNEIVLVMSDVPNGRAIGKCFLIEENDKYTLNQRIGALKSLGPDSRYLFYSLNRNRYFLNLDDGVNQTNLRKEEVLSCPVRVPPLPEQQKIADILSTVDDHISETESLIEKTKVLKQGMMQQLLTKGIGHTEFKDTEIGRIPVEWDVKKAGELFNNVSDKNHPEERILTITQDRGAVYRDESGMDIQSSESSWPSFKLVNPGDFVISLRSFQGGIEYSQLRGIVSAAYTVLKSLNMIVDNYYMYYFKSPKFISDLSSSVIGIRDGKQISYSVFKELYLPFPHIEEQQQIAFILISIDDQIDSYQAKLTSLTKLKSALMQQLLTGKTRVKV